MVIAERLRDTNRAEYLLYMWQVEDLLRVYGCDAERIAQEYISRFGLQGEELEKCCEWYANLCNMMLSEGVREKGHLQINRNTLTALEELHRELLDSNEFPYYRGFYMKALPHIVALRTKGIEETTSELETCFNALYGILMLRLKNNEISTETKQAADDISKMLGQLSEYFRKMKAGNQ